MSGDVTCCADEGASLDDEWPLPSRVVTPSCTDWMTASTSSAVGKSFNTGEGTRAAMEKIKWLTSRHVFLCPKQSDKN